MIKLIFISFLMPLVCFASSDTLTLLNSDSILCSPDTVSLATERISAEIIEKEEDNLLKKENIFALRLRELDKQSPMDLAYNDKVQPFIDSYLGRNKALISRMQGIAPYYFPMFEQQLDQYSLPLEFKYLAIVESALNPKAKSRSGASGLWQFMYMTGKQYGLNVNSYNDDRQDPLKATKAACEYFTKLYDTFGDWNLVLAAYNGGPGYLQRKIISVGTNDFWELYPHLRKETRNYIPTFIAVNYVMNYAQEHGIESTPPSIAFAAVDTLVLKKQIALKVLNELLCVNKETINYLNPSYKKEVYPKGAVLILPQSSVQDFLINEETNYDFIDAVVSKEILIDEERIIYRVNQGDYLGRIAKQHNVAVFQIKEWNKLKSSKLAIGDKLIIYVPKAENKKTKAVKLQQQEYIVKKGDTLWRIAKNNGLSIWKIKSLNNLDSDNLKPGTKIILPIT